MTDDDALDYWAEQTERQTETYTETQAERVSLQTPDSRLSTNHSSLNTQSSTLDTQDSKLKTQSSALSMLAAGLDGREIVRYIPTGAIGTRGVELTVIGTEQRSDSKWPDNWLISLERYSKELAEAWAADYGVSCPVVVFDDCRFGNRLEVGSLERYQKFQQALGNDESGWPGSVVKVWKQSNGRLGVAAA